MNASLSAALQNNKYLWFLVRFLLYYLALSTLYTLYLQVFPNQVDPFTRFIGYRAYTLASWFIPGLEVTDPASMSNYLVYYRDGEAVMSVIEGCNGLSVVWIFFAYILSFRQPLRRYLVFIPLSIVAIQGINLVRIALLTYLLVYYPEMSQFSHDVMFPGILYGSIALLWILWNKKTA